MRRPWSTGGLSRKIIIIIIIIIIYKDLTIEIQSMRNVKTNMIPVIIGATGTISKSFRKYVSNMPGKHEIKELQKGEKYCTHTSESTNVKVQ